MSGSIQTKWMEVTPSWAKQRLEITQKHIDAGEFLQRNISPTTVASYSRTMTMGAWMENGEPICFDEDGNVLNGRHRLSAVVHSGKTIRCLVVSGLPKEKKVNGINVSTIDTYDRNRIRGVGTQLSIGHGIPNANVVAACCLGIAKIATGEGHTKLDVPQTLYVFEIYRSSIEVAISLSHGPRTPSTVLAPLAMFHSSNSAMAESFGEKYSTKIGLRAGDPELALTRWVDNHKVSGGGDRLAVMKVVASCIYAKAEGRSLTKVYASDEALRWLQSQQKTNIRKICDLLQMKAA